MRYYHGTTAKRFKPGQLVRPGRKAKRFANVNMAGRFDSLRQFESGRKADMHDMVWITTNLEEALNWAEASLLKSTSYEIRTYHPCVAVYEVAPFELETPTEQHSATEHACTFARVISEVYYDPIAQDLCDGCGDDNVILCAVEDKFQLCAQCAEHEELTCLKS